MRLTGLASQIRVLTAPACSRRYRLTRRPVLMLSLQGPWVYTNIQALAGDASLKPSVSPTVIFRRIPRLARKPCERLI